MLESDPAQLKRFRSQLKQFLARRSLPAPVQDAVLLAAGEACTNAIRHAYGGKKGQPIRFSLEDKKGRLVLRIRDYGRKIDPRKIKTPELPPQRGGGLGLYFMETVMDKVQYNTRHRRGNELILTKYK